MIGVIAASVWISGGALATAWGSSFAAGGIGAAGLAAGVGLVGTLLINALIPPPMPKASAGGDPFQQLNSLTGT